MLYPLYTIGDNDNAFLYAEYPHDLEKGSFLHVQENAAQISVRVDRFSTIPFYFAVYKGRLYGSTKLHLLLQSLPPDFPRRPNAVAAIEFLRMNSMLDGKTLLEGIDRVPNGHELIFNKREATLAVRCYWRLPGSVRQFTEKEALAALQETFLRAIRSSVQAGQRVGMHLSGGMDSRQIFGAFLKEHIPFAAFTYGVPQNIDVKIAKRLAAKFNIPHHYFPWQGVNGFKVNADEHFLLTDGMHALYHGHGIDIHKHEREVVDVIVYGHFLDLFIQAHRYDSFFETGHGPLTDKRLYELFDGGPCSVLRGDSMEPLMLPKKYRGCFRESIYGEIDRVSYMEPEKRYDALYFLHHGARRLMPQVQAGAQFLDFRVPGLEKDFFDVAWSVPGKLRMHRTLQQKLLLLLNRHMMAVPVVKDNTEIFYMGKNVLPRAMAKAEAVLRRSRIPLLRPHYDYYGRGLSCLADKDLYSWMRKEVLSAPIMDCGFINAEYVRFLFSGDSFNPFIGNGHYGALFSLSKFLRSYV